MGKFQAYGLMSAALGCIVGGTWLIRVFVFPRHGLRALFSGALLTVLMHAPQIPMAREAARARGLSPLETAVKTTLFGASWWWPLKQGVIAR